jgi:hypothetical protein
VRSVLENSMARNSHFEARSATILFVREIDGLYARVGAMLRPVTKLKVY